MAMGKGMRMYMMAGGQQGRQQEQRRRYSIEGGEYTVNVNGGGNRNEGGYQRTDTYRDESEMRRRGENHPMDTYRNGEEMRIERESRTKSAMWPQWPMYRNEENRDGGEYEVSVQPMGNYRRTGGEMRRRNDGERMANYGREDDESRNIGFGARMMDGDEHHSKHMQRGTSEYQEGQMPFGKKEAMEWVKAMDNEDRVHPRGPRWTEEQVKALAQKYGIATDGDRWWQFYAMVNAMYSDYSEVAKRFNITSPDYYAMMAKAFMDDRDAVEDKVAMYYHCIAK